MRWSSLEYLQKKENNILLRNLSKDLPKDIPKNFPKVDLSNERLQPVKRVLPSCQCQKISKINRAALKGLLSHFCAAWIS